MSAEPRTRTTNHMCVVSKHHVTDKCTGERESLWSKLKLCYELFKFYSGIIYHEMSQIA